MSRNPQTSQDKAAGRNCGRTGRSIAFLRDDETAEVCILDALLFDPEDRTVRDKKVRSAVSLLCCTRSGMFTCDCGPAALPPASP